MMKQYAIINKFEEETNEANKQCKQADFDIRDFGKKVHNSEIAFEEKDKNTQRRRKQYRL
jgi:hypothetical protein